MYVEEIRIKVIDLLAKGKSQQAVGEFLDINPRTIRNWLSQLKSHGTLSPQTHKPRYRKIDKDALRAYIKDNSDRTLQELSQVFQVSIPSMYACLKKMSVTLKKKSSVTGSAVKKAGKISWNRSG